MNLDCMSPDELFEFWMCYKSGRNSARTLFPARPAGYVNATRRLANYASNKAVAMQCRLRGDIVAAQVYEIICDSIYDGLPAFARW